MRQILRVDTTGVAHQGAVSQAPDTNAAVDFEFTSRDFATLFDDSRSPTLRIIVDVQ